MGDPYISLLLLLSFAKSILHGNQSMGCKFLRVDQAPAAAATKISAGRLPRLFQALRWNHNGGHWWELLSRWRGQALSFQFFRAPM